MSTSCLITSYHTTLIASSGYLNFRLKAKNRTLMSVQFISVGYFRRTLYLPSAESYSNCQFTSQFIISRIFHFLTHPIPRKTIYSSLVLKSPPSSAKSFFTFACVVLPSIIAQVTGHSRPSVGMSVTIVACAIVGKWAHQ